MIVGQVQRAVSEQRAVGARAQPILGVLVAAVNLRAIPPVGDLVGVSQAARRWIRIRLAAFHFEELEAVPETNRIIRRKRNLVGAARRNVLTVAEPIVGIHTM